MFFTVMGLQFLALTVMLQVMERVTVTSGKEKCRKFTDLVNFFETMGVISAYIAGVLLRLAPSSQTGLRQYCWAGVRRGMGMLKYSRLAWLAIVSVTACQAAPMGVAGKAPDAAADRPADTAAASPWAPQTGTASYYGRAHQGRRTASGVRFDQMAMTAAHASLPFGTKIRVTLQDTGRSVIVTITDRLYSRSRILDLSLAAARQLGMIRQGIALVSLAPA